MNIGKLNEQHDHELNKMSACLDLFLGANDDAVTGRHVGGFDASRVFRTEERSRVFVDNADVHDGSPVSQTDLFGWRFMSWV